MKRVTCIALFLLFLGLSFAATYSTTANFEDGYVERSDEDFRTGISFKTDYTCSIVSGKSIGTGDPCKGEAQVCTGSTIRIRPYVIEKWATGGNLQIDSLYPFCRHPEDMENYTTKTENKIVWINSVFYDQHSNDWLEQIHEGSDGEALYNSLGGNFPAQSVDYYREVGELPYTAKKGYADVICKGRWAVSVESRGDGGDMSSPPTYYEETFTTEGRRTIRFSLQNVECFAAVVKHPVDSGTDCFRLYVFAHNAPSIPTVTESSVISVVNIQPGLDITGVRAERSSGSTYLLRITVRNTGDVREQVTAVHPISGSAHPAGGLDCMLYGWFCSGDNGFNEYINPGDSHDLYVTYSGTLSGDIFRLDYESPDPTCNASTTWNTTVNIPPGDGITRCEIQPMGLALTPYEIHEWSVTCYNAIGAVVPCVGDDWSFDRINGGFISKSSRNAIGYVTETSCLLPTPACADYITYRTGSVMCAGRIISYPPEDSRDPNSFVCDLTPDSANLNVGDSQDFTVNCSMEGTPASPTRADYDTVNGLDGSLTGETTRGVTFTATTESEGDVQVIAWYTSPSDPTLRGAIDWSHVIVGNITNQTTNETAQENETPSEGVLCVINPSVISPAYPSMSGTVVIKCGPSGNETCDGVSWSAESATVSGDNYGAVYTVRSDARSGTGRITATIDTDPHHEGPEGNCEAVLQIQEPECIIIS